jgi:hypothetical protein
MIVFVIKFLLISVMKESGNNTLNLRKWGIRICYLYLACVILMISGVIAAIILMNKAHNEKWCESVRGSTMRRDILECKDYWISTPDPLANRS